MDCKAIFKTIFVKNKCFLEPSLAIVGPNGKKVSIKLTRNHSHKFSKRVIFQHLRSEKLSSTGFNTGWEVEGGGGARENLTLTTKDFVKSYSILQNSGRIIAGADT